MNRETEMGGANREWQQTAWTQVLQARDGAATTARSALERLIEMYWKPVYFHIRRSGIAVEDAKDLTQQFFFLLMKRDALQRVNPEKGKFRSFLLSSLRNFLCDEYDRKQAMKRQLDLDYFKADQQYTAAGSFERDWATVVLDRAFARLRALAPREAQVVEAQRMGKTPYRELAASLGTTEANVKVMAHRGKKRLRAIILEELRETVSQPGEEQSEIEALFQAFG